MSWGNRGREIEDTILYVIKKHPEYSISEMYKSVQIITAYPVESIRRVKSSMLKKYKEHVIDIDILELLEKKS